MNRREHLLTISVEECGEVAQRLTKLLRFGPDEVQPDEHANPEKLTNRERVLREYADLVGVLEMAGFSVDELDGAWIDAKKSKVAKYLEYSKAQGTLYDA